MFTRLIFSISWLLCVNSMIINVIISKPIQKIKDTNPELLEHPKIKELNKELLNIVYKVPFYNRSIISNFGVRRTDTLNKIRQKIDQDTNQNINNVNIFGLKWLNNVNDTDCVEKYENKIVLLEQYKLENEYTVTDFGANNEYKFILPIDTPVILLIHHLKDEIKKKKKLDKKLHQIKLVYNDITLDNNQEPLLNMNKLNYVICDNEFKINGLWGLDGTTRNYPTAKIFYSSTVDDAKQEIIKQLELDINTVTVRMFKINFDGFIELENEYETFENMGDYVFVFQLLPNEINQVYNRINDGLNKLLNKDFHEDRFRHGLRGTRVNNIEQLPSSLRENFI